MSDHWQPSQRESDYLADMAERREQRARDKADAETERLDVARLRRAGRWHPSGAVRPEDRVPAEVLEERHNEWWGNDD